MDDGVEIVFTGFSLIPETEERAIPQCESEPPSQPPPPKPPPKAPKEKRPFTKSDFEAVVKAAARPLPKAEPLVAPQKETKMEQKEALKETRAPCPRCGELTDEGFCEGCLDDDSHFIDAMRSSKTAQQATHNWAIWRHRLPKHRTDATPFLDNCERCGNLIWVDPWERKAHKVTADFCSKRCAEAVIHG